ncbi:MAG: hypothetical protein PUP92_05005 [Rhizonema sp. PD38]|nr:hypothetical protein [Rhizonema sp. PD38]
MLELSAASGEIDLNSGLTQLAQRSPTELLPSPQKLNDKHGNIWTFELLN